MSEEERKVIAFLLGVVHKLAVGEDIDHNEVRQINNLMDEFGTHYLDEQEFRY